MQDFELSLIFTARKYNKEKIKFASFPHFHKYEIQFLNREKNKNYLHYDCFHTWHILQVPNKLGGVYNFFKKKKKERLLHSRCVLTLFENVFIEPVCILTVQNIYKYRRILYGGNIKKKSGSFIMYSVRKMI